MNGNAGEKLESTGPSHGSTPLCVPCMTYIGARVCVCVGARACVRGYVNVRARVCVLVGEWVGGYVGVH